MTALSFFRDMQLAMDQQAIDIWNMVEYSRSPGHRLRLGEVTVTEMNFYRLRHFWNRNVYIVTDEPNETRTGSDWEWLIGYQDRWLQIRVQAKIVDRSGSFAHLGHGPRGTRRHQMDTLIDPPVGDLSCRWMPLYVFYTATPPATPQPPTFGPPDARTGCSADLARRIRDVYGPHQRGATLAAGPHLASSIRWSRVFNGLVARLAAGESLAAIIDSLHDQILPQDITQIDSFWDRTASDGTCYGDLPQYIREIIDERNDEFNDAPLAELHVETVPAAQHDGATASAGSHTPRGSYKAPALRRSANPELPYRHVVLERSSEFLHDVALPRFVSVIDIEEMSSALS